MNQQRPCAGWWVPVPQRLPPVTAFAWAGGRESGSRPGVLVGPHIDQRAQDQSQAASLELGIFRAPVSLVYIWPVKASAVASLQADIERACRTVDDPIAVHRAVAARLPGAVAFDRWCGLVLDPSTVLATGGYHHEGLPAEGVARLLEVECAESDVNRLPQLARSRAGVGTVARATRGEPHRSRRYREVLEPSGLGQELRVVLRDRKTCWGAMVLLRETSAPDFSDVELRFVADVASTAGRAIRRTLLISELRHRDSPDVPGMAVLELGEKVRAEVLSHACHRWFADIEDGVVSGTQLPYSVVSLARRARQQRNAPARIRLRTRSGRWITLCAEFLGDNRVSVIVEPAHSYELAAIICQVYGLTARERDVARLLINGNTNREIAERLWLSAWTVQDHIKKLFEKLGVHSRSAFVNRMFFDQYVLRVMTSTPVGGDGWFITTSGTDNTSQPAP